MTTTIGVLAQKGGVGKTTLTLHWAVEAQETSKGSIAVIDIDTPQCSAASWGERREKETPVVLRVEPHRLPDALTACESNGMQYVFVDTMPRVERPALEAARQVDLVIIPCGPSLLDIEAIGQTVEIVQKSGTPAVIVVNQGRAGSPVNEKASGVLKQYGYPVCPVVVMRRANLIDAFTDGRAVRELEPRSKAAKEISDTWAWITKQLRPATKEKIHAKAR
jgi:chromosome partitioning protein